MCMYVCVYVWVVGRYVHLFVYCGRLIPPKREEGGGVVESESERQMGREGERNVYVHRGRLISPCREAFLRAR